MGDLPVNVPLVLISLPAPSLTYKFHLKNETYTTRPLAHLKVRCDYPLLQICLPLHTNWWHNLHSKVVSNHCHNWYIISLLSCSNRQTHTTERTGRGTGMDGFGWCVPASPSKWLRYDSSQVSTEKGVRKVPQDSEEGDMSVKRQLDDTTVSTLWYCYIKY